VDEIESELSGETADEMRDIDPDDDDEAMESGDAFEDVKTEDIDPDVEDKTVLTESVKKKKTSKKKDSTSPLSLLETGSESDILSRLINEMDEMEDELAASTDVAGPAPEESADDYLPV
jgi:hypothetical protein